MDLFFNENNKIQSYKLIKNIVYDIWISIFEK